MSQDQTHSHMPTAKSADEVRSFYNREAAGYRSGEGFRVLLGERRVRRALMARATGKILDVASGTGENFPFFPPGSDVTAVELSPVMMELAKERALQVGLKVDLQIMDAQHLTFPDATFDTVVTALATCTFPDPLAALREMGRVCKPNGQILLFEHGRSRIGIIAVYQDRSAPQYYENNACRWNQDSAQLVKDAGLTLKSVKRALAGIFYVMEAAP